MENKGEIQIPIYSELLPPGFTAELNTREGDSVLLLKQEGLHDVEVFLSEREVEVLQQTLVTDNLEETLPELIHTFYLIAVHDPHGYETFEKGWYRASRMNRENIMNSPLEEYYQMPILTPSHEILEYRRFKFSSSKNTREVALNKLAGSMYLSIEQGVNNALTSFFNPVAILDALPFEDLMQQGYMIFMQRLEKYSEAKKGRLFKYVRTGVFFGVYQHILRNRNKIRGRQGGSLIKESDTKLVKKNKALSKKTEKLESIEAIAEGYDDDTINMTSLYEEDSEPNNNTDSLFVIRVKDYLNIIQKRGIKLPTQQIQILSLLGEGKNQTAISQIIGKNPFYIRTNLEKARTTIQHHIDKGVIPSPQDFLEN